MLASDAQGERGSADACDPFRSLPFWNSCHENIKAWFLNSVNTFPIQRVSGLLTPVPRKHPLNKTEIEIGRRLGIARKAKRCSRRYLAVGLGVDPSVVTRVELGRAALRYRLARHVVYELDINPAWLATGVGRMHPGVWLPENTALNVEEEALFSWVYSQVVLPTLGDRPPPVVKVEYPGSDATPVERRVFLMDWFLACMKGWAVQIPDDKLSEFLAEIQNFTDELSKKFPKDKWQRVVERQLTEGSGGKSGVPELGTMGLTGDSLKGNTAVVKSEVEKLVARVKRLATEPGAKKELATLLDVDPPRISEWLSGKKEPGGNYTLQLLRWVELQERQAQ